MKTSKPMAFVICCVVFLLVAFQATSAADRAISVKMGKGEAEVSLLKGTTFLVNDDSTRVREIKEGDRLPVGSRVTTGDRARIELKLPDGSYIRFDENTTFELSSVDFDKKGGDRNIAVKMMLGKTWAKVARKGVKGRFALATKTAVAGVRGTTYRMNVEKDDSVMVKVYWGEVLVEGKKGKSEGGPGQATKGFSKPRPVLGPQPVAGPKPVTLKEWVYIVGALQQINIGPDGRAEKPFRFDIRADLNDWVQWNNARDEALGIREGK